MCFFNNNNSRILSPTHLSIHLSTHSLQNIHSFNKNTPGPSLLSTPSLCGGLLLGMIRSSPLPRLTDGSSYWEKVK